MNRRGEIVNLLKVVRLHIVLGGILAFSVGALLATAGGGSFDFPRAMLFYLVVFLGDLSTHFSNDYFDAESDKMGASKKFFAGKRILVKNPCLLPKAHIIAGVLLLASIALAGVAVLFGIAPFEVLVIAVVANFLGWFYSAPPIRLGSKGAGEAAIAFCAGFAIPAFGYLAVKGELDWLFGVFALPFMLYAFMLALSLEAPDIELDRTGKRKNIGVRLGKNAVFGFVLAASFSAFACFVFYAGFLWGFSVNFLAATVFSAVPLAAGILGFLGRCKKHADSFCALKATWARASAALESIGS
ncbi:MAG: prenyltransferase [Candidatus Bathyarchaeia archaeon]|jgi:1,4-dihydroxy-2-naphthoate octaprenyltransferase